MNEERSILHVDMDAFFASVEVRDDPTLAGKAVVVGGLGERGVVASCNYEARAYGVHSAQPSLTARRLCPHAVFLPGRYERYCEVSGQVHAIFERFTPLVESVGLDEAFLDVSGALRLFGPAVDIGWKIRQLIASELGLAASVGVARSKLVAKLASRAAKPVPGLKGVVPGRGVLRVAQDGEQGFLDHLPVEALWGVGPVTAAKLRRLGVTTVGHLRSTPVDSLRTALGRAAGEELARLARGEDTRPVVRNRQAKSIGHEETFATDRRDLRELEDELVRMADAVASRLRSCRRFAKRVSIKVRFGDFTTLTRTKTLETPTDHGQRLAQEAKRLLAGVDTAVGVRLLGLSASELVDSEHCGAPPRQLSFVLEPTADWGAANRAVDAVRDRFGASSLGPATILGEGGLRSKKKGDTQWGPLQR